MKSVSLAFKYHSFGAALTAACKIKGEEKFGIMNSSEIVREGDAFSFNEVIYAMLSDSACSVKLLVLNSYLESIVF